MRSTHRALAAALLPAMVILASCTGASPTPTATTVHVALQEWAVVVDDASVPAGPVTFEATNDGPNDPHELVVVKTDLEPGDLPTKEDGSVDEDGAGIEIIDEIEEFAVGETQSLTLDLEAGSYVLICNLVELEDGETEAHYQMGMRVAFTVE